MSHFDWLDEVAQMRDEDDLYEDDDFWDDDEDLENEEDEDEDDYDEDEECLHCDDHRCRGECQEDDYPYYSWGNDDDDDDDYEDYDWGEDPDNYWYGEDD